MTTFPLSVLVDPVKIEELFQKIENRKKLEQMLMDPRVIELSRQSPQSRQALAAVVRRLQEERARKRRIRNAEQKEEMPPSAKWFDCINFLKNFSTPPRHTARQAMKSSEPLLRQRNKLTRSAPNLESTALPSLTTEESTNYFTVHQPMSQPAMAEMSVCIPNVNQDGSQPINLMDFCTSEKGRNMIASLINSTDLKLLFGLKSCLPTECHQLSQCIDCLSCSDLRSIKYYVPKISSCQKFIILRSRASSNSSFPHLSSDRQLIGLKNVVSSATQTAYSGSCSQCSSNCLSTDSFSSYNEGLRDEDLKQNPYQLALCKRNNIIKGSKSQSAMYTTDYSECDCDNFSSPDEMSGGKYLSRILTKAVVPNIDYLTTPDVLVTYSGTGHSSDSGSSSSSCKACKGNISSESFQREPREIWTQKRLKTSCESCLNAFRTEYIRKSRYPKKLMNSNNKRGSFGSLSSDESSEEATHNIRAIGEEFYAQAKSILDHVGETDKGDEFDKRKGLVMKDVSIYEERIVHEEKYDVDTKGGSCLNSNDVPLIKSEEGQGDSNDKQTESIYESPQSLPPMIGKSISCSSLEKECDPTIDERSETQLDGGSPWQRGNNAALQDKNRLFTDNIIPSSTSGDDSHYNEKISSRVRKQRRRVRNKGGSTSCASDSSDSSQPQFRTFPRRLKTKVEPIQNPITTPQHNLLQKLSKQKSRKKNCAIM